MKCRAALALAAIFLSFARCSSATNFILNVNAKRLITVSGDRFLSITVDPIKLLNADNEVRNIDRSTNLAKALSPAYIRFGGPTCNSYAVKHASRQQDPLPHTNFAFSETQWTNLHQWSKTAGLDVIACIPPEMIDDGKERSEDLISFSDRMGYDSGWQLGYECQTRCNVTGTTLGKSVYHLRDALNAFPRYSDSIIIGPDIVKCTTKEERGFLEDYFAAADHALTAITWHPNFPETSLKENELTIPPDNLAALKRDLDKTLPISALTKPLWIAESGPEASGGQYLGALFWARRLGSAAKLGAEVVMRQPSDLLGPTPDYWVSLLHKTLVGPEVLGMRIQMKNVSNVYFYSQCTKLAEKYSRGSVTIFAVNLSPTKAVGRLKGLGGKTIHKYVLSSDSDGSNKLFAKNVLLNDVPLKLTDDEKIPDMSPVIIINDKGLDIEIAPYAIGFWVVPDASVKACMEGGKEMFSKKSQTHQATLNFDDVQETENSISFDPSENERNNVEKSSKKQRDVSAVENDQRQRLTKIGARRELRRLQKFVRQRLNANNPNSGSDINLSQIKEIIEGGGRRRPKRSTIRSLITDSLSTRKTRLEEERERRLERKNKERKREHMPAYLEAKNDKDDDFYGFLRREPVDNFPKNDVYLTTGDSTEDKDYDYVKDDDELKDEQRQLTAGHVPEQDDTWVEDGNDFRGYVPNEFFENVKIHNVRVQNVKDFSELWEADCDCKDAVNPDDAVEDDSKTLKVIKVHPDEIQYENNADLNNEWPVKKSDYLGSSDGQYVAQDLQATKFNTQTQDGREPQRFLTEIDTVTPGRISPFSNEKDSWRSGRFGANSRRPRRNSDGLQDLNNVLYNEMVNEDNKNLKECDCNQRVIRGLNIFPDHCDCETKKKRDIGKDYPKEVYHETTTQALEKESIKQAGEIISNHRAETDNFYDKSLPEHNSRARNQNTEHILTSDTSFSTTEKVIPVVILEVQRENDLHESKDEHKEKMNVASTTPRFAEKNEDEHECGINQSTQVTKMESSSLTNSYPDSPIFDDIPQIVISNDESINQATTSGHTEDVEQKMYETSTPVTEKIHTNVRSEKTPPINIKAKSDNHSTETSESTTPEMRHATVDTNINNENKVTVKSPQTEPANKEHKQSTTPEFSKELEYEHQTSNPVKKNINYPPPMPNLKHEDVVTEDTPHLKMRSQFLSQSTISPKLSELEDESEKTAAEQVRHETSHILKGELEDMLKPTSPAEVTADHASTQSPDTNDGQPAKHMTAPSKIKRQSKKESTGLFRDLEGRPEEMASDLQGSTPVPERPATMALDRVSENPESIVPKDVDQSDHYATSSPADKIESASRAEPNRGQEKSAIYLAECTAESSTKDEQSTMTAKSCAPTSLPPVESSVLREEVSRSPDIEPISTMAEVTAVVGHDEFEPRPTGKYVEASIAPAENSEDKNGASTEGPDEKLAAPTEDSVEKNVLSSENSTGKNLPSTENLDRTNISSTEHSIGTNVSSTENSAATNIPSTENPSNTNLTSTEKAVEKNVTSPSDLKTKPNPQASNDEFVRARGLRYATRSDALSALKQENDARRARRLSEYIKYQEYQRKRTEQLDELRERLRQKREKVIQKYRTDLLELEKSYNEAGKILKRRDAFQGIAENDLASFVDPRKPTYVLTYMPADYEVDKNKEYRRREVGERMYVPVVEVERPLRIVTPKDYSRGQQDMRLLKCASCSDPRNLISPTKYVKDVVGAKENYDDDKRVSGKSFYTFFDNLEVPWMFDYAKKSRTEDYGEPEPLIYDQSQESVNLDELYDYDNVEMSPKQLFKDETLQEQNVKSRQPNNVDTGRLQKFQSQKLINSNEEDQDAALEEYDDYGEKNLQPNEASKRAWDDKDNKNRPIVYLFDSNLRQNVPDDVYEQSVRALLNILAQRGVDRDIVQSSDAKNTSKNKRSPNDGVGDYSSDSQNEVKEDGTNIEIASDSHAGTNKETNRRGRRHATNDRTHIDADSVEMTENMNSLPKMAGADSSHGVDRDVQSYSFYAGQDSMADSQGWVNEIGSDEDPLFREHFQRKDELLKELRGSQNVLIKRLKGSAGKLEVKTEPMSGVEDSLQWSRDGMVDEFEKVQDLTESVEEFAENFQEKFNGTLTDDKQKEVDGNGGSNAVVHSAFDTAIINIHKFFSFISSIVRLLHG